MISLFILISASTPLAAQCADGSPPPCRAAAAAAPAPRVALDENLIAIFPFRISGGSQESASLREGAMDLLALALDEQAGLRVVPSRTLLARARNFTDASAVSDAAAISRGLGAGTMILGSAVVVGTQVRARAELHDVVRNRAISSVEARGLASDPAPVIDSLAAALARLRLTSSSSTRRTLQEFASNAPGAIRAYVSAENLSRLGRWPEAAESLQAAIRLDSTFGLAYYRLTVTSRYGGGGGIANPLTMALRLQDRLPRRQRDLLHSVLATQRGDLRDALTQADAIAAAYPDDPEVAFEQGEAYYHVGAALGEPVAPALRAWMRAIALDSTFIEPYNHVAELLVLGGDTAAGWRLTERALALAPTAFVLQAVRPALRAIRGETPSASLGSTPVTHQLIRRIELELDRMLDNDPARALDLEERFLALIGPDATRADREAARNDLAEIQAARGRFAAAAALAPLRRRAFAAIAGRPGPRTDEPLDANEDAVDVAAWDASLRHDTAALLRLGAQLRAAPSPAEAYGAALASCLDGRAALERGDSAQARRLLGLIAEVKPFASTSEFGWNCLMLLARLERAAGDLDTPARQLGATNSLNGLIVQRAQMEELRAQVAEQRGDRATAIRSYRIFVSLWQNADPEFQPRVAAARAALGRLTT